MNLKRALNRARRYNEREISCSLSYLPVVHNSEKRIHKEIKQYVQALEEISRQNINSDITVKLHQLGIYHDETTAYNAVEQIILAAASHNNFVWIDMYLPDTVDVTIKIFRRLREKHQNVGICLQAYLKRTQDDLDELSKDGVPLRLVKGFYNKYDFESWEAVTENYEHLMKDVLLHSNLPAIATHDTDLIDKSKKVIQQKEIDNAEFQFFSKVCDDYAAKLTEEGYKTRIYIPYGHFWTYFFHEIKNIEPWQNLKRLFRFLFKRR